MLSATPFNLFSTGLDASGHALAGGAADPHYSITSGPMTTPPVMMPQGGFPFPYWTGDTISGWITPGDAVNNPSNAANGYQQAEGDYVYETTFDLTGYDSTTAVIAGLIGADNRVTEVQLNGVDVPGYTPTDASNSDFSSLRTLLITSGFMPGSNKLDFTVHNDPGDSWNPTGFRAQLNGTAQLTGTAFAVFGTGVDASGALLADGVPDPHYQLIAAPAPDATGTPFVTIQNGYPYPYWTGDGPNSKWISPEANENDMAGGATDPVGDYTYETTFDLTGFDPSTARIAGYVSADNTLEKVLLNGQDIGYPSSGTNDYTDLHPLVIDSGFQAGVNTLDFVVYNAPQSDGSNAHNPSAFRAEMSGTAAAAVTIASPGDQSNALGDPVSLQIYGGDADGDVLTYSATGLPVGLQIDPSSGVISGTVSTSASLGTYTAAVTAADGESSASASFQWSVVVSPVTLDPLAEQFNEVGDSASVAITASGGGAGPLTFSAVGLPPGLSIDAPSGVISGTIDLDAATQIYSPTISVTDGSTSDSQSFDWTVFSQGTLAPVDASPSPPLAAADTFDVAAGVPLPTDPSRNVLDNDFSGNGDALQAVLVSGPAHTAPGSFVLNSDGTFAYTAAAGYVGLDTFTYQAADGSLLSDPVTVTLNVTDQPVAHDDVYTLGDDGSVSAPADRGLLSNDFSPDGSALTAVLVSQPSSGTVSVGPDGAFSYTPAAGQSLQTSVSFSYEAVTAAAAAALAAGQTPAAGVSGVAFVTLEPKAASQVDLQKVNFLGAYAVSTDAGQAYATNWIASSTYRKPVAYALGDEVNLSVQLLVTNPAGLNGVKNIPVRGAGAGLTATGMGTLNGGILTVAKVQLLDVNGKNPTADVGVIDGLDLNWQVLPVGGDPTNDWIEAGISRNRLYVTYKAPVKGMTLYHTLLRVGTLAAAGKTADDDVIDAIIAQFQTHSVRRVLEVSSADEIKGKSIDDGKVMQYWATWNATKIERTTKTLLRDADGDCESWTKFFLDTLRAQGLDFPENYFAVAPFNGAKREKMLVSAWTVNNPAGSNTDAGTKATYPYADYFESSLLVKKNGFWGYNLYSSVTKQISPDLTFDTANYMVAQGEQLGPVKQLPLAYFDDHVMAKIKIGDKIAVFDPSYGKLYQPDATFDQNDLTSILKQLDSPENFPYYGMLVQSSVTGLSELVFRANPRTKPTDPSSLQRLPMDLAGNDLTNYPIGGK